MFGASTSAISLYHIADSALPLGGFSYSYGMESAIKHGAIKDIEEAKSYLCTFANQVISFEFPFVDSMFQEGKEKVIVWEKVEEQVVAYEAMILNPMVRRAGLILGNNWIKVVDYLMEDSQASKVMKQYKGYQLAKDFPLVFGLTAGVIGYERKEMLQLYFFMSIRDQISAMIRLGVLGPMAAHRLQNQILTSYTEEIKNYKPKPFTEAFKSAFLQEVLQLRHHCIYSKLFQN